MVLDFLFCWRGGAKRKAAVMGTHRYWPRAWLPSINASYAVRSVISATAAGLPVFFCLSFDNVHSRAVSQQHNNRPRC